MKSIRAKIMWLLFGGVLISSLIIGIMAILLNSAVIEKNTTENMNLLCKTNANEINTLFAKIEDSVDTLAHYAAAELTDTESLKDDSLRAAYSAALQKSALHHIESAAGAVCVYMNYDSALIGKNEGFLFLKNENTNAFESQPITDISLYDPSDEEHVGWWYKPVKSQRAVWLEAYYNPNIDRDIISYIVPIYKQGVLVGVIGADISTTHIESLAKEISIFTSGKAAVLNSDGTVMYHPNFERGHLIGEGDPGFDGVVESLLKEAHTDKLISYELDGVNKRIASYKLRNGMLMVCFAPVAEIYKDQINLIIFTSIIIVFVISISLLIAFFISRRMARPIKSLNEAAKHLTDGNFDFNIHTAKTHDEIGELTSTFIQTRDILKRQIHLLDTEAHRDGLTGVGNKSAFMDREAELNKEIAEGTADFAVAAFDVNKLKITNDVFGHLAGDKLLSTVSAHLSKTFEASDIYRVGGDEFVVVVTGEQKENFGALIKTCVDGMKNLTVESYPECRATCAYGISYFNKRTDRQLTDVLRRADKEMYNNKAITKKDTFPWQEGEKGIKQLQFEKYCQLLQTLTISTDDYLFLMNTETGVICFFGEDTDSFDIADGRILSNGIEDMLSFVHANDHALIKKVVSSIISHDTESIEINFRMYDNKHAMHWVSCRGSVIKDETDSHFVVIGRLSKNAVKHLYNPITTLFNKTKLTADLQSNSLKPFTCLMLLDIDNLSEFNLMHGSVYGDNLLRLLAEELERRFSMWQIYHAEKDRFVVLLDVESSRQVENIFEQIKLAMASKCSISAAVVPNDRSLYINAENIYDYAVQLLNNAKKDHLGQIVFFSNDSLLERLSAVELLKELEESVEHNCAGFSLVYQPQINAKDYSIISAEALLRFNSKTNGLIYPERFIPVLEQTGLINDVGLWVINEALQVCKKWREFIPDFKISVNLSPKQLQRKRIATQIPSLVSKYDLPGSALILEITESAQLDENQYVFSILTKLKKSGIQIAIDDFGTGYSNLGNLKNLHADILKVDRLFIRDIKENGYNFNLIHNVVEFAKSNSLKVCFEGVENANELVVLSGLQPHYFQGYLFDKPCTADMIEAKYFMPDSEVYVKRLEHIKQLRRIEKHAPVINMETKTILRGINVGLWIIRINTETGKGELYSDETMKKLLGVNDDITPKECYTHWESNIKDTHRKEVAQMIRDMAESGKVVQVEYPWYHPQRNELIVRCSGRCVEKKDDIIIFEGFHRIISD